MPESTRTAACDHALGITAYRFAGLAQPFPSHFHEHYVIGLVEAGTRRLCCCGRDYTAAPGDLLLFNPGDPHACTQAEGALTYRCLNIPPKTMGALAQEITGQRALPRFCPSVWRDGEAACCLAALHALLMEGSREFAREEQLLLLLERLIRCCARPFDAPTPAGSREVEAACRLMEREYARRITLDDLCRASALSRSTLLRAFARQKGVTPYRYLETVRVNAAKRLLEQGVPPAEAALQAGFADQSHFTNYFTRFIGLPPGAYREIVSAACGREGNAP